MTTCDRCGAEVESHSKEARMKRKSFPLLLARNLFWYCVLPGVAGILLAQIIKQFL